MPMNESPRKLHIEPRGRHVSFLSNLARRQEMGSERLRNQFRNIVERGESPDRRVELLKRYSVRCLFLALFMVPANIGVGYWEIHEPGIDLWLLWAFLAFFDLIILTYAVGMARLILEWVRDGSPRMSFQDNMVRRGGTLEATFCGGRRFKDRIMIYAYLRCVEERFVRSGRTQHLACFERFKSQKQSARPNLEGQTLFRFEIPADAPASNFAGVLPTYWEIVVTYEATGPNYEGVFLAPVEAVE